MNENKSLNLLIVDDEVLETEYMLTLLQKAGHSFANIFVAFNVNMAQEILKSQPVDLVLCDIEMPQESGLDLLRWIRREKFPVEVVIVTCHPEFTYAQEATRLSSVDYILKPVSLDQLDRSLRMAIEALKRNRAASRYLSSRQQIRDMFFLDLMQGELPTQKEALAARMKEQGLEISPEEKMVPLFFRMDFSSHRTGEEEIFARKTVLVNIVQDILFDFKVQPWYFFPETDSFFIAFSFSELRGAWGSFRESRLRELMRSSAELLLLPMACFVGKPTAFDRLPEECRELQKRSQSVFVCPGEVCLPSFELPPAADWAGRSSEDWLIMLENGRFRQFREKIESHLKMFEERRIVPAGEVLDFSRELSYTVLRYLRRKEMDTVSILNSAQQESLSMKDKFFIKDFIRGVEAMLDRLEEEVSHREKEGSIVQNIAAYIRSHATEDMDREGLARKFGLSPEYLSRLFSQKMGMSLISFITQTKLEFCRHMFEITNCSVHWAAEQVGYTNFSYFSKLFRDYFGCTPQQYKANLDRNSSSKKLGEDRTSL